MGAACLIQPEMNLMSKNERQKCQPQMEVLILVRRRQAKPGEEVMSGG